MGNEENLAITPEEAVRMHLECVVPKEVFQAVNAFIAERCCSGSSFLIKQHEVIARTTELLKEAGKEFSERDFYDKCWLDFEPYYREKGWIVQYKSPCAMDNENFDPYYKFTPAKKDS